MNEVINLDDAFAAFDEPWSPRIVAGVNDYDVKIAHVTGEFVWHDHPETDKLFLATTRATLDAAGITAPIGVVLADAGYWSADNATAPGPDRLIATTKDYKQRRAARELGTTTGDPPHDATPAEAMEHRLRTEHGAAAYATRSHTVEPIWPSPRWPDTGLCGHG